MSRDVENSEKALLTMAKQFVLASSSINAIDDINPLVADDIEFSGPDIPLTSGKFNYLKIIGEVLTVMKTTHFNLMWDGNDMSVPTYV